MPAVSESVQTVSGWRNGRVRAVVCFALALALCAAFWEVTLRALEGRLRHFDQTIFPGTLGEKIFRLRELQKNGASPDTLFVGDSSANTGLSPKVFEQALGGRVDAYNLGEATYPEILPGFARYLDEDIQCRPRRVIVACNWSVMNEYGDTFQYFVKPLQSYAGIRRLRGTESLLDILALWRYRKVPVKMAAFGPPFLKSADWLQDEGWTAVDKRLEERPEKERRWLNGVLNGYLTGFEVRPKTLDSLRRGVLAFKKQGADVTFVLSPAYHGSGSYRTRVEQALQETRQKVFPMVEACGIRVLDCSDLPFLGNDCFIDPLHLNRKGATLYTQWLAGELAGEWHFK